ncbi:MAG: polymer-forming cytoskeletal protein [Phycisphaerae bacterium]|nr:polymer-forming cytoskeletal protein [Phycisphaerae bacterium]
MAEVNGEFPTVIGTDAKFKGEMTFEKGVRIEGGFEGNIKSKGTLHVAEGAKVAADVEAANIKVEGECKGNLTVSEKLHLLATARMEGDLRTNRLEITDGAMFTGHVTTGQAASETSISRPRPQSSGSPHPHPGTLTPVPGKPLQPQPPGLAKPRPQDIHISAPES